MLKILTVCLLLVVVVSGVFFVLAPYQASRIRAALANRLHARGEAPLVLATAAEDGAYYALGTHLRLHLDASQSYTLAVQPTAGSVENLVMLKDGRADLALIQGGLAAERSNVSGDWGGLVPEPEKLVALANLGRQYVHVVVPADSQIRDFRDLAGMRLGVGASNGGFEALSGRVMDFFNFSESTELIHDHSPDLGKAFRDGEIDAAFTVYSLFAPAMEKLLGTGWYRLIPIAEAEAASRFLPGVFSETLPPYLYGPDRSMPSAEDGPFQTLAVNTLLVCQSELPDRVVYSVLEEIFSGPFLKMARLTDLDEARAQAALHLPLHTAAEAFYNRRDPISSDRFEILSFFLAGVVCLASVVHFMVGRRRISLQAHRRVAIRPYFDAMMDFGDAVENASNPANLTRLIHKIMATQRGAERAWLEGEFDTEDMENLYAVYSLRCSNAFNKIFDLHLQAMRGLTVAEPPRDTEDDSGPSYFDHVDREEAPKRVPASAYPPPWSGEAEEPTPAVDPLPTARPGGTDHDFFTGAPLAGIDQTKKEVAASLPNRYDAGLLYDTEASGAGAVRVRTPKPAAELQATINRNVPEPAPEPPIEPAAELQATVNRDVPEQVVDSPVEPFEPVEQEERPDQMMLF